LFSVSGKKSEVKGPVCYFSARGVSNEKTGTAQEREKLSHRRGAEGAEKNRFNAEDAE